MDGERFAYREVDWDEPTEMAANIAANKGAGEFDIPALQDIMHNLDSMNINLDLTMFDEIERGNLLGGAPGVAEELHDDGNTNFSITVDCRDAAHHAELMQHFTDMGLQFKAGCGRAAPVLVEADLIDRPITFWVLSNDQSGKPRHQLHPGLRRRVQS